jgi:hypothetical protein
VGAATVMGASTAGAPGFTTPVRDVRAEAAAAAAADAQKATPDQSLASPTPSPQRRRGSVSSTMAGTTTPPWNSLTAVHAEQQVCAWAAFVRDLRAREGAHSHWEMLALEPRLRSPAFGF